MVSERRQLCSCCSETKGSLEEAIEVIRLMWSDETVVSFEGRHYHLKDARSGPRPAHPTGTWLGAFGPRKQRLVGRKADGWIPSYGALTRDDLRVGNQRSKKRPLRQGASHGRSGASLTSKA